MKKLISIIFFLVLVFYYLYPSALPLFGYSFVFTLGVIGVGLYVFHKFPFGEVISILGAFGLMFVWSYFCTFINGVSDSFIMDYTRSQAGWFFGAYLLIYIFYKIHPKGGVHLVMYYIVAAILLQCVISVAMFMDPAIADFFNNIQKISELEALKRAQTEGDRLVGYGTAFFGAGAACGLALIILVYILMTRKWNFIQLSFGAVIYCTIFYIGLLSARTTLVGLFVSLIFMVVLLFTQRKNVGQAIYFVLSSLILFSIGYTLCYVYFPDFANWAFEAFINYQRSGEFRTVSSDGLNEMFVFPSDAFTWIFGKGIGSYMFTDVGFSRLLLWFGLPGAILYFYYQIFLIKQTLTKNQALDMLFIVFIIYSLVLNYKGLIDINAYAYLFVFYFLYYKYYIYTPYLYRLGKFNQNKLRFAIQTPAASRRI